MVCLFETFVPVVSCTFLRRASLVSKMQASKLGNCDDVSLMGRRHSARDGRIFRQSQMRSRLVIIDEIVFQDPAEMPCIEDDHVIKALPTDRTYNAFDVAVLPW